MEGRRNAAERQPERVAAGAGVAERQRAVGAGVLAVDHAREVDEQRPVVEAVDFGEAREQRPRLGAEAGADVEAARAP